MRERIDHESLVPLYHQVAEAVRYRIATGELRPGRRLPSLRRAAAAWGVNLHTVRRAYGELAEQGIVAVRPRSGAVVLDGAAVRASEGVGERGVVRGDLEGFLRGFVREGRERWGLGLEELLAAVAELGDGWLEGPGVVHVVECSETQARDLAGQVEARWRVRAEPWSLEREGEPGPGTVLATYFHYNDVRTRWPARFREVRFAAIEPDAALRERLDAAVGAANRAAGTEGGVGAGSAADAGAVQGAPFEVVLCERTEAMARNIAADLSRILPAERYAVRIEVGSLAEVVERTAGPVLAPPRVWAEAPEAVRGGRVLEVRYVFEPGALERLGTELRWEAR